MAPGRDRDAAAGAPRRASRTPRIARRQPRTSPVGLRPATTNASRRSRCTNDSLRSSSGH
jgi:hypothetical protein